MVRLFFVLFIEYVETKGFRMLARMNVSVWKPAFLLFMVTGLDAMCL